MALIWLTLLGIILIGLLIAWRKQRLLRPRPIRRERFHGLQWRMTFSYVWITLASFLTFALLISPVSTILIPLAIVIGLIFWFKNRHKWNEYLRALQWRSASGFLWITLILLLVLPALFISATLFFNQEIFEGQMSSKENNVTTVNQIAQQYASAIAQQARGQALGNSFPYPLGRALTSNPDTYTDTDASSFLRSGAVPYLPKLYPAHVPITFALLIAPDQRILSSSYPARYPLNELSTALLPVQSQWIAQTLHGRSLHGTFIDANGTMIYATASIPNMREQTLGAIYMQVPLSSLQTTRAEHFMSLLTPLGISLLLIVPTSLVLLPPLGGIFGFISTRGLVKRLKMLAHATTLVANGDYQPRLLVASKDEIGQLEQQFNRMTEQLGESVKRQKELAEENARLAERSRISRELHDAISQNLFSLSMLAGGLQSALPPDSPLQRQVNILEQTTNTAIREMRALLLELRPTHLAQLSLVEALEELAAAYRTRLDIQVKTDLARIQLEARRAHTLLRIAQEALANAARHASATEIHITLASRENMLLLCIEDNGRGFQKKSENLRHGLGLRMMQERVEELHGTFTLESAPDCGTRLEILLPLEDEL